MSVRDVDRGFAALIKKVKGLNATVTVGVHGDAPPEKDGTSVVDIATFHEFGTATIPARSFIRGWVDANGQLIQSSIRAAAEGVIVGKYDANTALEKIGVLCVGGIQSRMSAGIAPPLAAPRPRTHRPVAKRSGKALPASPLGAQFKGHTPLIDTGHLRASITFKVDATGGK